MRVVENASLASMTTLRVGGPARRLVEVDREEHALEVVRDVDARNEALLVLGGGSNLVIADEGFDGTVLRLAMRGVEEDVGANGDRVIVTARAGETWDEFVSDVIDRGLAGVECLGGIPGLVGAVPMQNVGAYGQDVSETLVSVRTWDRRAGRIVEFDRDACRFAYRSSVFRGRDDHVILAVRFALPRQKESMPIRYAELARALGVREGERAPTSLVRDTVVRLRRAKGMVLDDADHDTWSAGSFFTNPILDASALEALRARAGDGVPVFPEADGRSKVSAAWLIERSGFAKGHAIGRAAISTKHALAMTNRGGATTAEIVDLARAIQAGVRESMGVVLENEPVFVGIRL